MSNTIQMPKPRTEAQRAAARANGAKSKGPITPEGKSKSALNALRHGMLAGSLVLTSESRAKFEDPLHGYLDDYQPEGRTENDLVEAIVAAKWLQQRCWSITNSLMNVTMDRMAEAIAAEFSDIDTGTRTSLAFLQQADQSAALALLNRYAARHDREWHRAIDKLRAIQKERSELAPSHQPLATEVLPNEPEPARTPAPDTNSSSPLEELPNEPEPDLTPAPATTSDSQLATSHESLATKPPAPPAGAGQPATDTRHLPVKTTKRSDNLLATPHSKEA